MNRAATAPRRSDELALATSFFVIGISVAVGVTGIGTSDAVNGLTALIAFSATSELAYVAVRVADGTVLAALVSGWLVASRFGVLCITLGARLPGGRIERALAALTAVDPNVTMAIQQPTPEGVRAVYWRITGILVVAYLSGISVGIVLGSVIGDIRTWGLDVVFPAALLSIVAGMLRRRDGASTAVVAAAICAVLIPLTPGGVPILGSLAALAVGLRFAPPAPPSHALAGADVNPPGSSGGTPGDSARNSNDGSSGGQTGGGTR